MSYPYVGMCYSPTINPHNTTRQKTMKCPIHILVYGSHLQYTHTIRPDKGQ